jgi:FkbM family methyltransferase
MPNLRKAAVIGNNMKVYERLRLMLFYRLLKWLGVRHIGGHWLYAPALHKESLVVDGGANLGRFSLAILQSFGCRCIAIEPVEDYLEQIPEQQGLQKLMGALSGSNGHADFWVSGQLESSSLHAAVSQGAGGEKTLIRVPTFSWSGFRKSLAIEQVTLLKLDIEGAEIELLRSMTDAELLSIPQLIIEFHDFIYPEQVPDIRKTVARLKGLGFLELTGTRNHLMDMIFLNRAHIRLSPLWHILFRLYKLVQFKNNRLYKDD